MVTRIKRSNVNIYIYILQMESSCIHCSHPALFILLFLVSHLNCTQNQVLVPLLYAVLSPALPTVKFYFPVESVTIPFPVPQKEDTWV